MYRLGLQLLRRGSPEKKACLEFVPRGGTVFDIGANDGYFTLLLSDIVGPNGRVHCFEPVPPTRERLTATVKNNANYKNIEIHGYAVSDLDGSVSLNVPGNDYGQASIRTHSTGAWGMPDLAVTSYATVSKRLDSVFAPTTPVAFIKCDIEGAELLALRGMEALLRSQRPHILVEVFDRWTSAFDYSPSDLFQFLNGIGYATFTLLENVPQIISNPGLAFSGELKGRSVNILCIHKSPGKLDGNSKS